MIQIFMIQFNVTRMFMFKSAALKYNKTTENDSNIDI